MSNAKEQQKGGFGAFARRENERRAAEEAARAAGPQPVANAPIVDRPVLVTDGPLRTPPTAGTTPVTRSNGRAPRIGRGSRFVAALAVFGALTASGCVSRTLDNDGLEAIPSPLDTAAVGNMVVSPEDRALGQRIMQFDNTGTAADRAARRKHADLRMTAACGGDYRTGAEGPAATAGVVDASADGASQKQSPLWYIQFVCVRDQPETPARP